MSIFLILHISGGVVAILAGYVALFAAKGRQLHRGSGIVFVGAMVVMAGLASGLYAAKDEFGSAVGALLAVYLVVTALTTVRAHPEWVDSATLLLGMIIGVSGAIGVTQTLARGETTINGVPVFMPGLFVVIALGCCASDIRYLREGAPRGSPRIRRHLWRMCFAMFIATGSFFLGQADELPVWLRSPALLVLPALGPLLVMPYWLWRHRSRRPRAVSIAALPLQEPA